MRFLVTGGCGFIGSRLIGRLHAEGHEAIVLDDLSTGSAGVLAPGIVLVEARVEECAANVVRSGPLDGIFHLAAVSSVEAAEQQRERAHRSNVEGTRAVFEAAAGLGSIPVVLASSAAVYGVTGPMALSEDQAARPAGIYGTTKLAAEGIATQAFQQQGVPSVALRLFNVYGPWPAAGRPPAGVIAEFCRRIAAGERLSVHGDGRQQRDFFYIDDAVELLLRAMARVKRTPTQLVVNGCTGVGTSLLELAGQLSALSSRPLAWTHGPSRPVDVGFSVGDPWRAGERLRFYPATNLATGLSQVLNACMAMSVDLAQAEQG